MACSDNVVRAGLTPKLVDAKELVNMLDYSMLEWTDHVFKPVVSGPVAHFKPPVADFAVQRIQASAGAFHDAQ